ncbi:MAG: glycoside hydrolase family 15 protein [Acidimicrobiales bacterium]
MGSPRIEDYALLSDTRSAAMVSRDGSVDWLTFPRFDSPSTMAALVGTKENGHFSLGPAGPATTTRRYLPGTLVLETTHATPEGTVAVTDVLVMPDRDGATPRLLRRVEGVAGRVPLRMELRIRFGYGEVMPWVRRPDHHLVAVGGPDAVVLYTDVPVHGDGMATVADFAVGAGECAWFELAWFESHRPTPPSCAAPDSGVDAAIDATVRRWREWSDRIDYDGRWADDVKASAIVLKGLTYSPTGAIVAAPTTSLPEDPGGVRNWDYRHCWLRDATFTLYAFVQAGLRDEAQRWRDWLLRAVAGDPEDLQIMYGLAGERRLPEFELDWLRGFGGARPVRIGNGAAEQLQLDVFGEIVDSLYQARVGGMPEDDYGDDLQVTLLRHLEQIWRQPDEGIWEVRGDRQHFTHSKVMAWVAFDRAAKSAQR